MIWLPGILSQRTGYKWKRYNIAYTEKAGSSTSVTRTSTYKKMTASNYTKSASKFTLTSPVSTAFSSIASGKYLVSIDNATSSTTSGTTLYKVTSNTGKNNVKTTSVSSFSSDGYGSFYGAPEYTLTSDGLFQIAFQFSPIYPSQGFLYHTGLASSANELDNLGVFDTGAYGTIYRYDLSSIVDGWGTISVSKLTVESSQTITYTPYTLTASKGTYIDTVTASDILSYPENGAFGGYWYVLQT